MKVILAIAAVCLLAICPAFAQEPQATKDLKPSAEDPKEVKLQEVDGLKIQNVILTLNNLATQLQLIQTQFNQINEDKLPALIKALHDAYKLPPEDWAFDLKTMAFQRKVKQEAKK